MSTQQIRDGIWAVELPIPAVRPAPTSMQAYLVEDAGGRLHLIDTGWDSAEGWDCLTRALSKLGRSISDLDTVTITHLHLDHIGLARRLQKKTDVTLILHAAEQWALNERRQEGGTTRFLPSWGVPPEVCRELHDVERNLGDGYVTADVFPQDGDLLPIPGRSIEVLHTPGHTPGHLALYDAAERLLFSGDLVLERFYPGFGLGGMSATALHDMLGSLERVAALPDPEIAPGHGPLFTGGSARALAIAAHHRRRADEVLGLLAEEPELSAWEAAQQMRWAHGWESLTGHRLLTALSQTAMLLAHARQSPR